MERLHSGGQHLCKLSGKKRLHKKRVRSTPSGCHFIVLEHQHGRPDVM